jgi:hypothetical protein
LAGEQVHKIFLWQVVVLSYQREQYALWLVFGFAEVIESDVFYPNREGIGGVRLVEQIIEILFVRIGFEGPGHFVDFFMGEDLVEPGQKGIDV